MLISHSAKLPRVDRASCPLTLTCLISLVSATEPKTCTAFPVRTTLVIIVVGGMVSRKLDTPPELRPPSAANVPVLMGL